MFIMYGKYLLLYSFWPMNFNRYRLFVCKNILTLQGCPEGEGWKPVEQIWSEQHFLVWSHDQNIG